MDEAGRGIGVEGDGRCLLRGEAGGQPVPFEAAMDAAARQLRIEAAPQGFDDIVERQGEAAAQLDDQSFLAVVRLSRLFYKSLAPQRCRPDRSVPLWFAAFRAGGVTGRGGAPPSWLGGTSVLAR